MIAPIAPLGPTGETEATRRARIQAETAKIADAIRAGRLPPEAMQRYVERERITPEMEAAATPLTGIENVRGGLGSALQGATFNLSDEIVGGARGLLSRDLTMGEGIDEERAQLGRFREENPKTALGLELGGGLATGLGAAGAVAGGAKGAAAVGRVAASGVGGGAIGGYGSGEGGPVSASRLGRAGVGGALGGTAGYALGKVATSRVGDAVSRQGRDLLDALVEASDGPAAYGVTRAGVEAVDPTTQAAVRSIFERMGSDADGGLPKARTVLDELRESGQGEAAMAADVLPGGSRELRRASNISPTGEAMARERLTRRGANVGPRVRSALTKATGLTPETTQGGVGDLVAARAAKADPSFATARAEGVANRMTPRTPEIDAFLNEPDVRGIVEELSQMRKFRGMSPDDPEMLDAIFKVFSDRQGKVMASQLVNPKNVGRFEGENIGAAKSQALDAISGPRGPMPSYRRAVTEFADDSQLKDAYESGVSLFNKPVGDIRSAMAKMTPDEQELFKRGAFDALIEKRVDPLSPNPALGEAARQSKGAGQAAVNTQAAADRIREVFGADELARLEAAARAEGRFHQTLTEGVGNSTTAKQLQDMGIFGSMAQEGAASFSPSPMWWGARAVRGMARKGSDFAAKHLNEPANREAVRLLTEQGPENITTLMELLEALGQTNRARTTTAKAVGSALTRPAVGRVP